MHLASRQEKSFACVKLMTTVGEMPAQVAFKRTVHKPDFHKYKGLIIVLRTP